MHRPGHVQGGQEAKRGYLLLGVYHRRIPGFTISFTVQTLTQFKVRIDIMAFVLGLGYSFFDNPTKKLLTTD
jgi:hypothetical protein